MWSNLNTEIVKECFNWATVVSNILDETVSPSTWTFSQMVSPDRSLEPSQSITVGISNTGVYGNSQLC